jgi:hypothetical protein
VAEDTDGLVARAIESVLDQVPGSVDTSVPEGGAAKLQPWAETAAPVGRNKRPLEELLVELEERVAASPDAQATLPRTRHPALAFFDRFGRSSEGRPERGVAGDGTGRRRRRRRGGGGGDAQTTAAPAGTAAPSNPPSGRPQGGRRRSRRGRSGAGAGGAAGPSPAGGGGRPRQDSPASGGAPAAGQPRAPGTGRRRRGRRGRGGERPPASG